MRLLDFEANYVTSFELTTAPCCSRIFSNAFLMSSSCADENSIIANEKIVEELGLDLDPTAGIFDKDGSETLLDPMERCRCYQEISSIQREAQEGL